MNLTNRGHIPIRTCVVCGDKKGKFSLLRMALSSGKRIVLDDAQRIHGRGAYVCPGCLSGLHFSSRLRRTFRNQAKGLTEDLRKNISARQD